ncbi:MAG: hypothetical protein KME26_25775 [Oscillatoria princeps RMCB-10]|nr:hypothetical protein [Oscillatoria princeps RMCB-10]
MVVSPQLAAFSSSCQLPASSLALRRAPRRVGESRDSLQPEGNSIAAPALVFGRRQPHQHVHCLNRQPFPAASILTPDLVMPQIVR